jgi:hypothetical protein
LGRDDGTPAGPISRLIGQTHRADPAGDVETNTALEADRLQRNCIAEAADQHIWLPPRVQPQRFPLAPTYPVERQSQP